MRHSTALAVGLAGMGLTASTTAGWALGIVPREAWIVLLILGVGLMLVAFVVWLRGEPQPPSPDPDPWDELKAALAEVNGVRTWLNLRENPDERLPLDEDRVFQWAKKTFQLIESKFPEHAD